MRKLLMLLTAGVAVIGLSVASVDLVAQRDGGPGSGSGGPGRGGPGRGPAVNAQAGAPDANRPDGPRRVGRAGRGGQAPLLEFGRNLNLTEEQRTKVQALTRSAREKVAPLTDELGLAERTLHRELYADKADTKKIADVSARIATLRKQIQDIRISTATSVAEVLTPDQRQQVRVGQGRGPFGRGR